MCVSLDGIYHYMKKQTGPDSVQLKTDEDLKTFIDHYDASIIGMTCDLIETCKKRQCHVTVCAVSLQYVTCGI